MAKVSILIPARNEQFLQNTITDLLEKGSDIEVIAVLDGYWPNPPLKDDKRLVVLHRGQSLGMRAAINAAAAIASGEWLMKSDAHCMFEQGYDAVLQADCDQDWVVVPRRDRLDPENWCLQETGKPPIDYHYLGYPDNPNDYGGKGLNGKVWDAKNRDPNLKRVLIDDLMSSQGSCWFMSKRYFEYLELMDEANYGTFWNEFQEIGFKCWLSGGRCVVNKKTTYLHLHKGKTYGRGYSLPGEEMNKGAAYTMRWMRERVWHKQKLGFEYMIDKFWPVPTWPENWKDNDGR